MSELVNAINENIGKIVNNVAEYKDYVITKIKPSDTHMTHLTNVYNQIYDNETDLRTNFDEFVKNINTTKEKSDIENEKLKADNIVLTNCCMNIDKKITNELSKMLTNQLKSRNYPISTDSKMSSSVLKNFNESLANRKAMENHSAAGGRKNKSKTKKHSPNKRNTKRKHGLHKKYTRKNK
jgi:hypothetical protein